MKWHVPEKPIASYSVAPQLRDHEYCALLDIIAMNCSRFSLVWRGSRLSGRPIVESQRASEFARQILPFLIEEERVTEWPSTKIMGEIPPEQQPILRVYAIEPEAIAVVKRARPSLFHWLGPAFPEDPTFYQENGECSLVTCSHERGAELYVTERTETLVEQCRPFVTRGLLTHS